MVTDIWAQMGLSFVHNATVNFVLYIIDTFYDRQCDDTFSNVDTANAL